MPKPTPMTVDGFHEMRRTESGICLECGEEVFGGVEGDAQDNECPLCGANKVMGPAYLMFHPEWGIPDIN